MNSKCVALMKGLKGILGDELMSKEILKLLRDTKNRKERIILLALCISDKDEVQVEMYLKAVIESKS